MAQAVSRRALTAMAWACFEDIPSRICGRQNEALCFFFVSVLLFYTVSIIPPMLCTHVHLMSLVPEEQTDKARKPSKSNVVTDIEWQ